MKANVKTYFLGFGILMISMDWILWFFFLLAIFHNLFSHFFLYSGEKRLDQMMAQFFFVERNKKDFHSRVIEKKDHKILLKEKKTKMATTIIKKNCTRKILYTFSKN